MRKLRRIAVGLIVLFALQAGGAGLALASAPPCCPAMAGDQASDAAPPCRTIAALGCCEDLASGSAPTAAAPPPLGDLPAPAAALSRSASTAGAAPAACPGGADSRALRTTVLRL